MVFAYLPYYDKCVRGSKKFIGWVECAIMISSEWNSLSGSIVLEKQCQNLCASFENISVTIGFTGGFLCSTHLSDISSGFAFRLSNNTNHSSVVRDRV